MVQEASSSDPWELGAGASHAKCYGPNSTAPPSRVMQGSREQSTNTTKTPGPASAPSCLFKMSPQGTKLSRTLQEGLLPPPSGPYLGVGTYRGTGNRILLPSD